MAGVCLIEVDSRGREINEDTTICRMSIYASDPLVLNREEIMKWGNTQPQEDTTRNVTYNITVSGNVSGGDGITYPFERISGCKVYMYFTKSTNSSDRRHPAPLANNGVLIQGEHFAITDAQGNFTFKLTNVTANLTGYDRIGFCVARENDYVTLQYVSNTYSIANPSY